MTSTPSLSPPPPDGARLRRLAEGFSPWDLLDERELHAPGEGVLREMEVAAKVARTGRATFRLWRGDRALVVTRRETRLPRFPEARGRLEEEGWPVVVRDSGGTTVPHFPGALQVSLFLPRRGTRGMGVEDVYHLLCEPVRAALRALSLQTYYGEVPGSFCDGRFNLVSAGRKVAGTAQRWKGGVPGSRGEDGFVLGHMALFVQGELAEGTEAVNRLLRLAGSREEFRVGAQTTVEAALAANAEGQALLCTVPPPELLDRVRVEVADSFQRLTRSAGADSGWDAGSPGRALLSDPPSPE